MNPELVVIAGQLYRGEYVLALCTHRQDITRVAVHITNGLKSCLVAKKTRQSWKSNLQGRGPEAKSSPPKIIFQQNIDPSRAVWEKITLI